MMQKIKNAPSDLEQQAATRRSFLKWTGAALTAFAVGCEAPTSLTDADTSDAELLLGKNGKGGVTEGEAMVTLDFSNDFGVLNYAYALEQLEAAFYEIVVANFYRGGRDEEREVMHDLMKHEVIHREFFKEALGANAIGQLAFDFSSVNFRARGQVLQLAEAFEDTGVSAYNGAGELLEDPDLLTVAGKIVSVEARHASAVRSLRRPNGESFAPDEFDLARSPAEVLPLIAPFVATEIKVINL